MASLDELRNERIQKIVKLQEAGMPAYPSDSRRTHRIADVRAKFDDVVGTQATLDGRVMAIRKHGKAMFADVFDGSARIQLLLNSSDTTDKLFVLFDEAVDLGDIIEAEGTLEISKRGEQTLKVTSWRMLTKALRPLPDDWHGLQNEEERLRKRYLDMLTRDELREMVLLRAKFWQAVRRFHEDRGFTEVHTPILEVTTGGADARPFQTRHNALDIDVYLRISAGELWQKRLMVAGIEKTFEIGPIFRNEGMSAEHAQDYMQCEAYWAYASWIDMANFLRECYQFVIQETFSRMAFSIRGFDIDFSGEWPHIDYAEEIKKQTGVDIWEADTGTLQNALKQLNVEYEGANRERLVDSLWKFCRKSIAGPAILINEPRFLSPLAKINPSDINTVERFHFIIAGSEVGQGYSELNDPIDQRERFESQQALRDAGDDEAQMADMEFVEALEYGMPPTAGHGFSDRLFAFLMDKSIREIQLFPLVKPRE
ncbi:MAG: lysine--tRNA ligase [bacterium]|nr:lysine--tRNA ligase [bacterium]